MCSAEAEAETLAEEEEEEEEAMPPEGSRMAGLWEREVGRLPPKRFANAVMASKDFVHSLNIQKTLQKHRGCVNTITFNADGRLLLSGSDDRTVMLWNWEEAKTVLAFHTGHSNNVLHAQFMPFSDDRSIITCAADGEVRHSRVKEGGGLHIDKLVELEYAVHKLAVEPGNPHTFLCCGEDGSVWFFDPRGKDATELFKCEVVDHSTDEIIELFAIAIDPRNPHNFAVAGSDEYVRLYDARKINLNGNSSSGQPTEHFCPPHLIGTNKDGITGLAFSQTSELLASYSCENIYLFTREHGLHFNNIEVGERLLMDETTGACYIKDKLPVPQAFKEHQNMHTIKGVNFLGPNCDYVSSGSDCGNIFIWRKKDGELVRVTKGDRQIVNCVEQHTSDIVVASSGVESDIKIWAPGSENPFLFLNDEDESDGHCYFSSDSDDFAYPGEYMLSSDFPPEWASYYQNEYESEDRNGGEDEDEDDNTSSSIDMSDDG